MFLTGFPCFSILLSLPLKSFYSTFCTVFGAISYNSNIDKVLLTNLSSKVFIFRDFNLHHKDWLNFSEERIDLLKFLVIFNQSQVTLLRWSIFLLGSEIVICTVLSSSSSTLIYTWFLAVCVAAILIETTLICINRIKGKGKGESAGNFIYLLTLMGLRCCENLL